MLTNRQNKMRGAVRLCAGFTLLELIIVIGIIGVLTAILLGQFGGITESARATECLTHLRNLGMAVQSCGMAEDYYPSAGDNEFVDIDGTEIYYKRHKGFVTCGEDSHSGYVAGGGKAKSHQNLKTLSTYETNDEKRRYCVTNSAIWRYSARNPDHYICPSHRTAMNRSAQPEPGWSYVMNSYFGYDWSRGSETTGGIHRSIKYGNCKRPDRRLLFAELPWNTETNPDGAFLKVSSASGDPRYDGVLQYDDREGDSLWSGDKEWIGFNHKSGKMVYAHVCFADGHTEKLVLGNSRKKDILELTAWLCQADDIQQNVGRWERTHKTKDE